MSSTPPRLVLAIPSLAYGGAERQVSILAPRLRQAGLDVTVATFAPGGIFHAGLQAEGVRVHSFARGGFLGAGSLLAFRSFLRQRRPHLLHAFLWSANFRARLAGLRLPGLHTLISLRGFDDDLQWFHRLADRLLDGAAEVVVSNCAALRDDARRRGTGNRARHLVIYNGIEPGPPPEARPGGVRPPTVGFVGRLERKKNPLALVPAAALLRHKLSSVQFLVVGDGTLGPALRRAVAAAGLEECFIFAGAQPDVLPFYARMDVLVNTSLSEGCNNVILEAMRAGLPVVATAAGGNRETVADSESGFLVAQGDSGGMATALARVLGDAGLAERLGAAGRRRLEQDFSVAAMVKAYGSLYASLLAGHPAGELFKAMEDGAQDP